MPDKRPICASQANIMALKTILVLALASGAAAADKICMADETNSRRGPLLPPPAAGAARSSTTTPLSHVFPLART